MHLSFRRFFISLTCLLYVVLQAGNGHVAAAQPITPAQWQQLISDKAFSYKNELEKVKEPKAYKESVLVKIFRFFFEFFGSKDGKILLWLIVITIVCIVLYRIFLHKDSFLFSRNQKVMSTDSTEPDDLQDLNNTNWEIQLQNALANNDLRLAVRATYMRLLQLMQQRELIQYRIDKTNYEYYSELGETSYKQPFKQLSRQYEYSWYGRFPMSQNAYQEYRQLFDTMKKQLGA